MRECYGLIAALAMTVLLNKNGKNFIIRNAVVGFVVYVSNPFRVFCAIGTPIVSQLFRVAVSPRFHSFSRFNAVSLIFS